MFVRNIQPNPSIAPATQSNTSSIPLITQNMFLNTQQQYQYGSTSSVSQKRPRQTKPNTRRKK